MVNIDSKKTKYAINISIGFLFFLLLLFLTSLAPAKAQNISTNVKFNKLVYEPFDKMNVEVEIKPKEDIKDARVLLRIGDESSPVYSRTHYLGNLEENKKVLVEFSKNNVQGFGLKFGRNSILIKVTSKKKTIYKFITQVGLKRIMPYKKINVALALNVADEPHLDTEKNITDKHVQRKILPTLDEYTRLSLKYKGHISIIFNPLLADTVSIISNGYNLNENGTITNVPANSASSTKARKIIGTYKNLFDSGVSTLIRSTYSKTNTKISDEAFRDQVDTGKEAIRKVFSKYASNSPYEYNPILRNIVYCKDATCSKIPLTIPLLSKNKQESTIEALAYLAKDFNKEKENVVILTDDMINAKNVEFFIESLKKQTWINLKPVSALKMSKLKIKKRLKTEDINNTLLKAREKYFLLKSAFKTKNQAFEKAQMAIYLAEDADIKNKKADEYAQLAYKLLSDLSSKIKLKLSNLTLTGKNGKLPIGISNNTETTLEARLLIETKSLKIKNGERKIKISPKENVFSVPVTAIKSGRYKVKVKLISNNRILSEEELYVSTNLPSAFWYYAALSLAILSLLIIGAFYVRERRSRASNDS